MARRLVTFTLALSLATAGFGGLLAAPAYAVGTAPVFSADTPATTATVGTAYSYTFVASGSPTPTYSVSTGALPSGLSLDGTTGALAGTPTAPGTFTFTVAATNGVGTPAVSGSISVDVQGPPVFTADSPPTSAATGISYSYTYAASGNPAPSFSVQSGTLPPGLVLSSATGLLSGVPTTIGSYTFAIEATNSLNAVVAPLTTIAVAVASAPVFTADAPASAATFGTSYSYTFGARGSPVPTFFVASGLLPTGLSLNPTTGLLTGVATVLGTFTFVVGATNGVGTAATSPPLTIVVAYPSPPTFTSSAPATLADVGVFYSYTFAATASPAATFFLYSGVLPPGLTLDATTGVLAGVPSAAGAYSFVVEASNGFGVATTPTITIATRVLVAPGWTRDTPPVKGIVGTRYAGYQFAASGSPAPTYAVASGSLPPGLSLSASTGLLLGTPRAAGSYDFTIAASNGVGGPVPSPRLTITTVYRPVLTVRAHNLSVVGKIALVPVRCTAASCRGTIRLRHMGTVLGTVAYSVPVGKSTTVRVRLNATGDRLLLRALRRHLSATATIVDIGALTYLKAALLVG